MDSGSPKSPIKMVSSGLVRAKETADLIAPCLPADRLVYADPNPDLNEGRPAQVIPGRPYSNEAVRVDQQRVERAFRDTFRRADPRDDGARHEYEIVVCHVIVIRYMTLRALQLPPEAWLKSLPDTARWGALPPKGPFALRLRTCQIALLMHESPPRAPPERGESRGRSGILSRRVR